MIFQGSRELENPAMAWACKVKNFTTALRAREVRPDVMVPHSKVTSNCRPFETCVSNYKAGVTLDANVTVR